LATAIGAWINLAGLSALALRRGSMRPDAHLAEVAAATCCASGLLALVLSLGMPSAQAIAESLPHWRAEALLAILAAVGAGTYALTLVAALAALGFGFGAARPQSSSYPP
jgi:peptidoglycan biosynthesis protein MviN/MurJ (putative lipid II flippase)